MIDIGFNDVLELLKILDEIFGITFNKNIAVKVGGIMVSDLK